MQNNTQNNIPDRPPIVKFQVKYPLIIFKITIKNRIKRKITKFNTYNQINYKRKAITLYNGAITLYNGYSA